VLLSREAEARVMEIINAVVSSYSVYSIGRELGQTITQAAASALNITTTGRLTFLESSFIAGKAAAQLGTDQLRRMSEQELVAWIVDNNITITAADRATINQMKTNTERWLVGRSEAWQAKMRAEIVVADQAWRATLQGSTFADQAALAAARSAALRNLLNRMEDSSAAWQGDIDRLVQSEMNNYFQEAQVAALSGDELVYKVPRASACPHCKRICINRKGEFRRYKLSDVQGNSNIGVKALAWIFTIGPIHPYCYCVLYRESDVSLPPDRSLLKSLDEAESLEKNACGISDDPDLLFEEQGVDSGHSPRPAHINTLINAVKRTYGDSLPRKYEE